MNDDERKIIKSLNKIGVDVRYISLYENNIYINNLKFSKFSKKKEEQFHELYPEINVIRSTLLQKICIKVSRTLKNQIKPRDIIYVKDSDAPEDILLRIVLEPYRRKYGIKITHTKTCDVIVAKSTYLNQFIDEYFNLMTSANKIEDNRVENEIYPLEDIDYTWIIDWINSTQLKYTKNNYQPKDEIIKLNEFIDEHIPNYKQSIKQSVKYLNRKEWWYNGSKYNRRNI